jgi:hypothetical protein
LCVLSPWNAQSLILVYKWFILQQWKQKESFMIHVLVLCVGYDKWARVFGFGGFIPIANGRTKLLEDYPC